MGGWPKKLQKVVLGDRKPLRGRPGASAPPIDLKETRAVLKKKFKLDSDDDLYSHLMYPQVHEGFVKFVEEYGDVSVLPTPAYFYGLAPDEEISVEIETGKTLIIKLVNVGAADKDGRRTVTFELNGVTRQTSVADKSVMPERQARPKADTANAKQVGAPIPGMVASIAVSAGSKISKGDKLVTLEAMKMFTTINAPADGVVESVSVAVGETVESKDLLVTLQ